MRHLTRNYLLVGFCGCLLHLTGCGGSSEPTALEPTSFDSAEPATTNTASEPASSPDQSEATADTGSSSSSYEDPSGGTGAESSGAGGYEDPGSSYADSSGGYSDPSSGYGDPSGGYGDPSGGYSDPTMAGYGDSAYGAGAMGYGQQGSGNGFLNQWTSNLKGMMTPAVSQFASAGGASREMPKSYLDRAAEAYQAGNEPLARRLYLTHLVGEAEDADQAFAETQFSTLLKRPVWAMQWGVSVHVRFSGDGEERIHPVRQNMPSPMGAAGGRRGGAGAYGAGTGGYGDPSGGYGDAPGGSGMEEGYGSGVPGMGAPGMPGGYGPGRGPAGGRPAASTVDLSEELGLVAEVTSQMFGSRLEKGAYGSAFASYERHATDLTAATDASGNRNGNNAAAQPGNAGYGGYAEMSSATGEYGAGMPGMPAGMPGMPGGNATYQEMQSGYGTGAGGYEMQPGSGYGAPPSSDSYEMQPGGEGYETQATGGYEMQATGGYGMQPGGGTGPNAGAAVPLNSSVPAPELPRWRPGMIFVGKMNSTEALAKAQEHSLDFLLHFDVAVRTSKAGGAKNITRLRVYQIGANKPLVTSKPIDNIEIYKLAQAERKTEQECVEEVISDLFSIIDEKLVLRRMPTLTPEVAQKRIISLIESANDDLLRTLAEIRLYHWQEAINQEDLATAFHMSAGDDGLTILYGLPEAQNEVLERYIEASP